MATRLTATVSLALAILAFGGYAVLAQQDSPADPQADAQEHLALEFRTWTSSSGKYQIEAALVKFADGKAHLQKKDGDTIAVSSGKLSTADRAYIRQELARRNAGTKSVKLRPSETGVSTTDWPGWRGPLRDGKSPDTGLLKQWPEGGPKKLWQADGIGKGYSTVAVVGGTIYTTGDVGDKLVLFAFDTSGKLKWHVPAGPSWTKDHPWRGPPR